MPELPEVETICHQLVDAHVVGASITRVEVVWHRTLEADFDLVGRTITSIKRRGKYIILGLDQGDLVIHLRMSGKILINGEIGPHTRLVMEYDNLTLVYDDPRKFGRWRAKHSSEEVVGRLGPEPLGSTFTPDVLMSAIRRNRGLKGLLLDQSRVAGIGNIYVDEALWEAKLHPLRWGSSLDEGEGADLHRAIRKVLIKGIEHGGTSLGKGPSNYTSTQGEAGGGQYQLNVFRRTGDGCFRCGTPIERMVVAQRGTHICPRCQDDQRVCSK